jgi:hypothetical protein
MMSSGTYRLGRRGLAPLEMVLAIPLVMFTVALSVIVGTAACWKIRASVVARDAIWSHRWPRGEPPSAAGRPGDTYDPVPSGWPQSAAFSHRGSRPLADLDHQAFRNPVVRGPLPNQVVVNADLFDPTLRVRLGDSHLNRPPAMLPRLAPLSFNLEDPILDGKWQYRQMGIGSNTSRRLPVIYQFPDGDSSERNAFQRAYQNIISAPWRPALDVLDRDDEFIAWYGSAPDFHPRLGRFCSLDTMDVQQRLVERHIPRIDSQPRPSNPRYDPPGVPERMTRSFLGMYRQQLRILQSLPPPLTPQQQAQIAELQRKIEILTAFLATLN